MSSEEEDMETGALEFLEKNYPDDEFKPKGIYGGGAGMSHHGFVFSSNNYPENDICVVKSGEYYRDSYIPIKYENKTRKMLEEIATELVGDDYYIVLMFRMMLLVLMLMSLLRII